jgi:hypothetical protein
MSLNGSQRRDQRRRLVVSWKRSTGDAGTSVAGEARTMAAYGPEAHPEKQRGPATLLPTGLGGFSVAAVAILLPMAAALTLAAAEPAFGRAIFVPQGRFTRTIQAAAGCLDARSMQSLAGWLAQVSLGMATSVALIVRLMRRHRRDDYNGRYRAWGWLAGLFAITACAGLVPIGRLVGAAIADTTGITLGPDGIGWWIVLATIAYGAVTPWAVLPLHERGATAFWSTLALSAWAAAAGCHWVGGRDAAVIGGHAAWAAGAALAAIAMLAAARSVIREVRGQCRTVATTSRAKPERPAAPPPREEPVVAEEAVDFTTDDDEAASGDDTTFVDGTEPEQRHLSKAERKRLKKLARMNRAAA